jgi:aminopeptidase N
VLAPDFGVTEGEVRGVPIRVYSRYGAITRAQLLSLAEAAVRSDSDLLGVDYPWTVLTVVETEGGDALETPGLVWIPKGLDSLNRDYLVHHVIAHQWFYGLVGYNQRTEPFAGDAMADLLARSATSNLRASSCPSSRLDLGITGYSAACYYEGLKLGGALVLDQIRQQMGANRFWAAVRGYLEDYRYRIGGTKQLLDALRDGSDANIGAILRARFPALY